MSAEDEIIFVRVSVPLRTWQLLNERALSNDRTPDMEMLRIVRETLKGEADLPPAPGAEPEPEPSTWQPMSTRPRTADGTLAASVWVAHLNGQPPQIRRVDSSWQTLRPEDDARFGRVCWFPGHIARADLPPLPSPLPTSAPSPHIWQLMATCPRAADGTLTASVWISYAHGRSPLLHQGGPTWFLPKAGNDARFGRLGWLPGNLARADLPPAPEVSR